MLQPVRLESAEAVYPGLSEYEIETKLIKFYTKCWYEELVRGAQDELESVTLMGRTV